MHPSQELLNMVYEKRNNTKMHPSQELLNMVYEKRNKQLQILY